MLPAGTAAGYGFKMPRERFVIGVDGCRIGWIAVRLPARGSMQAEIIHAQRFSGLPVDRAELAAVDMPIGLAEEGPRACDIAARRHLPRGRKSSVFPPPRRYMLAASSWAEANEMGKRREATGLPIESWAITPKIREIDHWIAPTDQDRIRETHPEVAFHRMNDQTLLPPKRGADGRAARLRLLQAGGLDALETLLQRRPSGVQADDVLDAACCALVARRMLDGDGLQLPGTRPPQDARGLRMEIWC